MIKQIRSQHQAQKRKFLKNPIEFMTADQAPQCLKILLQHYCRTGAVSQDDLTFSNLEQHLEKLLKTAASKGSSFIIREEEKIKAICLNVDVKDILEMLQTDLNLSVFEGIGLFRSNIRNALYRYSSLQRGSCLFNIDTVFEQELQEIANKVVYLCRGLCLCKAIGWSQILFSSSNPFVFLKMGAEILERFDFQRSDSSSEYLIRLKLVTLNICHPRHTLKSRRKAVVPKL